MDRKWIAVFLLIILLLNGCAATPTDITREEIIAAYEQAGYSVVPGIMSSRGNTVKLALLGPIIPVGITSISPSLKPRNRLRPINRNVTILP